jgi:hypothetical protein
LSAGSQGNSLRAFVIGWSYHGLGQPWQQFACGERELTKVIFLTPFFLGRVGVKRVIAFVYANFELRGIDFQHINASGHCLYGK